MPTYEYECPKCGHHFEQFQSIKDAPLKQCPKCRKNGLKRLIGAGAGLIFKGSGFYITDYKKTPSKADAAKAKADTEGKPASSESKPAAVESKPAAPAKPAPKKES